MSLDVLFRGGRVVDGSGREAFVADVGVRDGRIVAVGSAGAESARREVDVSGLVVAPGFIDMHSHSDLALLVDPTLKPKVAQGITLEVLGQDGLSYAPVSKPETTNELRSQLAAWNGDPATVDCSWRSVGEFLDVLDRGVAVNVAYLVPHGTVRMDVVGHEDRPPTASELARMQRVVADALLDGAVGLSAGLTYTPGSYAADDELVALCRVVAAYGGYYCPHHRNYGATALAAYEDCLSIARRSGVALHLAHTNLNRAPNRGRAPELLAMLDAARRDGVDVTLDTYPYTAGSTSLASLLPSWIHAGGADTLRKRLGDPGLRDRLSHELNVRGSDGAHGVAVDWSRVVISGVGSPRGTATVGESVDDAASTRGLAPVDWVCELLLDNQLSVQCTIHEGDEGNVRAIMQDPGHTVGTDGMLVGGRPHPRAWGSFPRFLAKYVRELEVLTLEECVRHMTSTPARRLGVADRGLVRPGMAADLVVFDPDSVQDRATFEEPRRGPDGIPHVLVNGRAVVTDGRVTGDLPGRTIRREDRAKAHHG